MLNRLRDPHKVVNAALFLVSNEVSVITSANLMVDSGCGELDQMWFSMFIRLVYNAQAA